MYNYYVYIKCTPTACTLSIDFSLIKDFWSTDETAPFERRGESRFDDCVVGNINFALIEAEFFIIQVE